MFAGAGVSGRYVRIGWQVSGELINLHEVEAFGPGGEKLEPAGATMSTTYSDRFNAGRCIDEGKTTQEQICATSLAARDPDPWLRVDYGAGAVIATIVVTNRADCCKDRIVGATIAVTRDANGSAVLWSAALASEESSYAFNLTGEHYKRLWAGARRCFKKK